MPINYLIALNWILPFYKVKMETDLSLKHGVKKIKVKKNVELRWQTERRIFDVSHVSSVILWSLP